MALTIDKLAYVAPTATGSLLGGASASYGSSFGAALRAQFTGAQAAIIANRVPTDQRVILERGTNALAYSLDRSAHDILTRRGRTSAFHDRSVTSGDSTKVTAVADDLAFRRSFGIHVTQVATAHQMQSKSFDAAADDFGDGLRQYQLDVGVSSYSLENDLTGVDTNLDALNAIRDEINAEPGTGVYATVIVDPDNSANRMLQLEAHATGTDLEFTLSDVSGTLIGDIDMEVADTAAVTVQAQDAKYSLDGGAIQTVQSNTVDLFSNTVEVTLLDTTTEPVTMTVHGNSTSIAAAITDFTDSFNSLFSYATENESDLTTPLANRLNEMVEPLETRLRSIGVTRDSDGLFEIDSDELTAAIEGEDGTEIRSLFTGAAGLATKAASITRDFLNQPNTYVTDPPNRVAGTALRQLQSYETRGMLLSLLA